MVEEDGEDAPADGEEDDTGEANVGFPNTMFFGWSKMTAPNVTAGLKQFRDRITFATFTRTRDDGGRVSMCNVTLRMCASHDASQDVR